MYTYCLWGAFYLARHDLRFRLMERWFRQTLGLRAIPWGKRSSWLRNHTTMFYPSKRRRR